MSEQASNVSPQQEGKLLEHMEVTERLKELRKNLIANSYGLTFKYSSWGIQVYPEDGKLFTTVMLERCIDLARVYKVLFWVGIIGNKLIGNFH